MKLENREDYKWAKYRWEFMRRNPKAITALSKLSEETGFPFCDFILGPAAAGLNANSRKGSFWSPELTFEGMISKIRKNDPGLTGEILVESLVEPDSIKFFPDKAKLTIEINLDLVWSVESLKKVASKAIGNYYAAAAKEGNLSPKNRPNMSDFDTILIVGDMKRSGKKNREIAKKIYPRKFAENPESCLRLVVYYFKKYKELVDQGGFRHFVYP
jgi:hypothetical protein